MTRKKNNKIIVTKEIVTPPTRKLTATWKFESAQDIYPFNIEPLEDEIEGPLTEEQEADLIVKRLKQTPKERRAEEENRREQRMMKILAEEIVKEIDAEMIAELKKVVEGKGVSFDKEE